METHGSQLTGPATSSGVFSVKKDPGRNHVENSCRFSWFKSQHKCISFNKLPEGIPEIKEEAKHQIKIFLRTIKVSFKLWTWDWTSNTQRFLKRKARTKKKKWERSTPHQISYEFIILNSAKEQGKQKFYSPHYFVAYVPSPLLLRHIFTYLASF